MKIFISHAVADKEEAVRFVQDTQAATGLNDSNFFFTSKARTGLKESASFSNTIAQEYRAANVAVYLVSPNFWKSKNCIIEIGWALIDKEKKVYIFELSTASDKAIPSMVKHLQRFPRDDEYFAEFTKSLGCCNLSTHLAICKKINDSLAQMKKGSKSSGVMG